jgi:hypothetical protein
MARISKNWYPFHSRLPSDEEMVSEDFITIYEIIQNNEIDATEKTRLILKETKSMIRNNKIDHVLNK